MPMARKWKEYRKEESAESKCGPFHPPRDLPVVSDAPLKNSFHVPGGLTGGERALFSSIWK